jgi:hypothetical protein
LKPPLDVWIRNKTSERDSTVPHLNHPTEYNRMMETAKKRSLQLRDEAIDDFWDEAGRRIGRALQRIVRLARGVLRRAPPSRDWSA